jgi:hypothetical protein
MKDQREFKEHREYMEPREKKEPKMPRSEPKKVHSGAKMALKFKMGCK